MIVKRIDGKRGERCSACESNHVQIDIDIHGVEGGGMATFGGLHVYLCGKCAGKVRAKLNEFADRYGKTRPLVDR